MPPPCLPHDHWPPACVELTDALAAAADQLADAKQDFLLLPLEQAPDRMLQQSLVLLKLRAMSGAWAGSTFCYRCPPMAPACVPAACLPACCRCLPAPDSRTLDAVLHACDLHLPSTPAGSIATKSQLDPFMPRSGRRPGVPPSLFLLTFSHFHLVLCSMTLPYLGSLSVSITGALH